MGTIEEGAFGPDEPLALSSHVRAHIWTASDANGGPVQMSINTVLLGPQMGLAVTMNHPHLGTCSLTMPSVYLLLNFKFFIKV